MQHFKMLNRPPLFIQITENLQQFARGISGFFTRTNILQKLMKIKINAQIK